MRDQTESREERERGWGDVERVSGCCCVRVSVWVSECKTVPSNKKTVSLSVRRLNARIRLGFPFSRLAWPAPFCLSSACVRGTRDLMLSFRTSPHHHLLIRDECTVLMLSTRQPRRRRRRHHRDASACLPAASRMHPDAPLELSLSLSSLCRRSIVPSIE